MWEAYPWPFGEPYCLLRTFLTELTSTASVFTITAFTVERYVAICHPLRAHTTSSLPRVVKTILLLWLAAAIASLPYPLHTRTYYYLSYPGTGIAIPESMVCNIRLKWSSLPRVVKTILLLWLAAAIASLPYPLHTRTYYYLSYPGTGIPIPESLVCNIRLKWMPRMCHVIQASTLLLFVLPMCAMTALYVSIAMTVRRSGNSPGTSAVTSRAGDSPVMMSMTSQYHQRFGVVITARGCRRCIGRDFHWESRCDVMKQKSRRRDVDDVIRR